MKIGGLQEVSLCDFPGLVSTVVFTQGCNFSCPYCHNGALIPLKPATGVDLIQEDDVFRFLKQRRDKIDGVVISGGEPTLQSDLAAFAKKVKSIGLKVKLDTNGSDPSVLQELLSSKLLDFVAMDLKAPFHLYERIAGTAIPERKLLQSVTLIASSGLAHEFRTTVVEALLNSDDLRVIQAVVPAGSPYRLQECRYEHTLDPTLEFMNY
jgi:pyruvate formate lyase activating enzyme